MASGAATGATSVGVVSVCVVADGGASFLQEIQQEASNRINGNILTVMIVLL